MRRSPISERIRRARRKRAYRKAISLRGKVKLEVDLDLSRERLGR